MLRRAAPAEGQARTTATTTTTAAAAAAAPAAAAAEADTVLFPPRKARRGKRNNRPIHKCIMHTSDKMRKVRTRKSRASNPMASAQRGVENL